MKKLSLIVCLVSLFALFSCTGEKGKKSVELKTEEDKIFYSVGVMFGQRLKNVKMEEKELSALLQGLQDSASGKKLIVEANKYQRKIQTTFKSRMKVAANKIKKEGITFLENFIKKEGGKKTKSGLVYKVLKPGKGKKPNAKNVVEVHYHGTLIDGTVFDSSYDRKKKVTFPLNRVIKGWTEGLQLIGEGGKIKLVIPSELGYGDQGAPPKIPGGATLIFEVELYSVQAAKDKPVKVTVPKKKTSKK